MLEVPGPYGGEMREEDGLGHQLDDRAGHNVAVQRGGSKLGCSTVTKNRDDAPDSAERVSSPCTN